MGKYFGTDGFRGEANVKLTVDHAFKVGRYVGWYYGRDHKAKIVIGKDTRRSSYMFEYALVAGLTASGADVYLLHVTTTPSVSYAVRTEDFDCGIMISASHNPFYDNGIKLLNGNGQKIEAEVEARIEAYLDGLIEDLPLATKEDIGRTVDFASGRNRYIGHLISIPSRDFKGIKVGLDCANGSSSAIAKSVFEALQAKTYVINNQPDGTKYQYKLLALPILKSCRNMLWTMDWISVLLMMVMQIAVLLLTIREMWSTVIRLCMYVENISRSRAD